MEARHTLGELLLFLLAHDDHGGHDDDVQLGIQCGHDGGDDGPFNYLIIYIF